MTRTSVYALADKSWHKSFRPKGTGNAEWAARIRDHICAALSLSVSADASDKGGFRHSAALLKWPTIVLQ